MIEEARRVEKKGVELATPRQIRKLYAEVRNSSKDPREFVRELTAKYGQRNLSEFTKIEISKLIDQVQNPSSKFETPAQNSSENQNQNQNQNQKLEGKTEVVEELEEDKDCLDEIDALFSECLARAANTVSRKLPRTERSQAAMIFEIARMYFEEVRKGAKRG